MKDLYHEAQDVLDSLDREAASSVGGALVPASGLDEGKTGDRTARVFVAVSTCAVFAYGAWVGMILQGLAP